MKNIAVVIATYNGEKFIEKQIKSIVKSFEYDQKSSNYAIIIRDDGSSDETVKIINSLILNGVPIHLINDGERLGFKKSFLRLIAFVDNNYDIVFFSDQDDIWRQDKVRQFLIAFNSLDAKRPGAVYSDLRMFGNVLDRPIRMSDYDSFNHDQDSFKYWILANDVTGAALAINGKAVNLLHNLPESIWKYEKYHDWLLIKAVAASGSWKYINDDLTLYRQHSRNVSRNWAKAGLHIPSLSNFYKFTKRYYWNSLCSVVALKEYFIQDTNYVLNQGVQELMQQVSIVRNSSKITRLKYFTRLSNLLTADRKSLKRKKIELLISILVN